VPVGGCPSPFTSSTHPAYPAHRHTAPCCPESRQTERATQVRLRHNGWAGSRGARSSQRQRPIRTITVFTAYQGRGRLHCCTSLDAKALAGRLAPLLLLLLQRRGGGWVEQQLHAHAVNAAQWSPHDLGWTVQLESAICSPIVRVREPRLWPSYSYHKNDELGAVVQRGEGSSCVAKGPRGFGGGLVIH